VRRPLLHMIWYRRAGMGRALAPQDHEYQGSLLHLVSEQSRAGLHRLRWKRWLTCRAREQMTRPGCPVLIVLGKWVHFGAMAAVGDP